MLDAGLAGRPARRSWLRGSCGSASAGTTAACGAPAAPATTGGLSTTMPRSSPLAVERGRAGEARAPAPDRARAGRRRPRALHGGRGDRGAAALRLRIGDADERDAAAGRRRAEQADRRELARAIDAQQRELAAVLSSATRSALPRPGTTITWQPSTACRVGDDVAGRAHHQAGAVFDLARAARRPRPRPVARERRERARHRHHHRVHGAFHRLVVEDGDAAHLAVLARRRARRISSGPACPTRRRSPARSDAVGRCGAAAGPSSAARTRPRASRRCRCGRSRSALGPAPSSSACRWWPGSRLRRELARQAEARAGRRVVDQAPADFVLRGCAAAAQRGALLRVEDAGRLGLVALLERLDGVDQPVAEFAVDQAVVVAGPDQVGLDARCARRAGSRRRTSRRPVGLPAAAAALVPAGRRLAAFAWPCRLGRRLAWLRLGLGLGSGLRLAAGFAGCRAGLGFGGGLRRSARALSLALARRPWPSDHAATWSTWPQRDRLPTDAPERCERDIRMPTRPGRNAALAAP